MYEAARDVASELIVSDGWPESAELLLDDVLLLTDHEGKQVVLFRFGNFVLVQGGDQMLCGGVPIILRDLQPSMNRLHFTAGVNAGPANAHPIDEDFHDG